MKVLGISTAFLLLFRASSVSSTPRCGEDDLSESNFPVDGDCGSYWVCFNGIALKKYCPKNLLFNTVRNKCDIPENVDCPAASSDTRILSSTSFEHPDCPFENPPEPVILPHKHDCGKFYICNKRVAHEKTCLPGLHFNAKLKVCDYPKNAKCSLNPVTKEQRNPCEEMDPNEMALLPHDKNCSLYLSCWQGVATEKECPSGLHFNPKFRGCDYPIKAGCDERSGREVVVTESPTTERQPHWSCDQVNLNEQAFLPHPSNCSQFIVCWNGEATFKICPARLHFNPVARICDYPQNAGCDEHAGRETAVTESIYSTEKEAVGTETPMCPSRNGMYPVFFRDQTNCSTYYMCNHGKAYKFICPNFLHFNIEKNTCDMPYRAGCR